MKLGPYFTPYTKINSKWIKDLSVSKGIKPLEENRGVNLNDLSFDNGILDMTPKAQASKEKTDTLDFIKTKSTYAQKTLSRR